MNFISLIGIELKKIRRSKILFILLAAAVFLWIPAIFHADVNFKTQVDIGILPEHNFLIQGFMGLAWFMFPACMVVSTVLLQQTEQSNHGILKMLSLPLSPAKLCLAKFAVFFFLAALQILLSTGMYFIGSAIVSRTQNYNFMLSPLFAFKEAAYIFLASIPMLAFFWLVSVCIKTPVFSIGIGLASIVPSVLMINTKVWFLYPMAYPFFVITNEYSKLASSMTPNRIPFASWGIAAFCITAACLLISCRCFGHRQLQND